MMDELKGIPLWDGFYEKANEKQRLMVAELATNAAARLDRVIETFPNYTLHNRVHARNVVMGMSNLLGEKVEQISALEGAILILSAYLHDIGMVFTSEERRNLAAEDRFPVFLRENAAALVRLEVWRRDPGGPPDGVPADVAEWYCRWAHAERVRYHLRDCADAGISWNSVSLRKDLGDVCESHSYDLQKLWNRRLRTDFLGKADLLFCAILLRLADILDFDNSRTPDEVYRYLELAKSRTKAGGATEDATKSKSETEWRKHLSSGGFVFPEERGDRYILRFIAGPKEPAVEHDLLEFLSVIENEMRLCNSLLPNCAKRWQNFVLPFSIDPSDIISNGYKYGEFRFTLEQGQILDLLVGENIYDDPYVFVRELVQNSIDTTRHREFYEQTIRSSPFTPKPIQLRSWQDRDGYIWMRIDDCGMGMDENIVVNYLLKVGASYYRSAEFKAELLTYQARIARDFVPISRFGIGLLSCFITGDRLELSTYRMTPGADVSPLRLSMDGLGGFFTMHLKSHPDHRPEPMPSPEDGEPGFRMEPGTSIAVRLDPARDLSRFDLGKILDKYILHPPVPIEYEGRRVGGDYQATIVKPWLEEAVSVPFSAKQTAIVEKVLGKVSNPLSLRFAPLDLTAYSGTPNLAGQALLVYVDGLPEDWRSSDPVERSASVEWDKSSSVTIRLKFRNIGKLDEISGFGRFRDIQDIGEEFYRKMRGFERRLRDLELSTKDRWPFEYIYRVLDSVHRVTRTTYHPKGAIDEDTDQAFAEFERILALHSPFTNSLSEAARRLRSQKPALRSEGVAKLCERLHFLKLGHDIEERFLRALTDGDDASWNSIAPLLDGLDRQDTGANEELQRLLSELRDSLVSFRRFRKLSQEAERAASIDFTGAIPQMAQLESVRQNNGHWLSHNGVNLPTKVGYSSQLQVHSPVPHGWIAIQVALKDGLRPDLSLARDEIRGFGWGCYSRLALTLFRCLSANGLSSIIRHDFISDTLKKKNVDLGELMRDIHVIADWKNEPVIATSEGTVSLTKLREITSTGKTVTLEAPVPISEWLHGAPNFIQCLSSALLQLGATICVGNGTINVGGVQGQEIQDWQLLFPPLFFVPYQDSRQFRRGFLPINLNHQFSRWWLAHAEELKRKQPGLFESLRVNASAERYPDPEPLAKLLNAILARLRQIDPALVPKGLELDPKDVARY